MRVGVYDPLTGVPLKVSSDGTLIVSSAEFEEFVALASGTRTSALSTPAFTNVRYLGLRLYLDVSAVSGTTPTLDVRLQTQDHISTNWVDMANAAFPQVSAVGTQVLVIYPGLSQSMVGAVSRVSNVMARKWRIITTIGGVAPSFTFSIAGLYLP